MSTVGTGENGGVSVSSCKDQSGSAGGAELHLKHTVSHAQGGLRGFLRSSPPFSPLLVLISLCLAGE
jgi:hypothetical protein